VFCSSEKESTRCSADLEKRAPGVLLIWKREHPVFCSSGKESTRCSADLEKRAPGVLLIWKREHPVFGRKREQLRCLGRTRVGERESSNFGTERSRKTHGRSNSVQHGAFLQGTWLAGPGIDSDTFVPDESRAEREV